MISLNLRHLDCFLVLADELHFGRAAAKLFIAQPPLSRAIKELENDLDVQLFKRTNRRVELTPSGIFLKEEGIRLFAGINHIKEEVKRIEIGRTATIKVGYVGAAMHSVLPSLLDQLSKRMNTGLKLFELKNDEQVEALRLGQIDLGFVRSVPENANVVAVPLIKETFSLVLPLKHPMAKKERIHLRDLSSDVFIGLNYDCAPKLCDAIFDICRSAGFYPRIGHESSQINSILRLVEGGMGYSIVPTSVKHAYSLKVKFVELSSYKQRANLFLIHKKENSTFVDNCLLEFNTPSGSYKLNGKRHSKGLLARAN